MTERNQNQSQHQETVNSDSRTIAEWVTLGISLGIVLTTLGLAIWIAMRGDTAPATFDVSSRTDQVRVNDDVWYLPVDVRNVGDTTAADVIVRAELGTGASDPETAEFTIAFLSGGDQASGTVAFRHDPRAGDLAVTVVSFSEP